MSDISLTAELKYSVKLHVTMPFKDLYNCKFLIQWFTDYAKGQVVSESNSDGVLRTYWNFTSTAHGALGLNPAPKRNLLSPETSILQNECKLNFFFLLKGGNVGKIVGSGTFNLAEKVKIESTDINVCPFEFKFMKFIYLKTEEKYNNQILTKVDLNCDLIRVRIGNDFYKKKEDHSGLFWDISSEQENFDFGINFHEFQTNRNNNLSNSGKSNAKALSKAPSSANLSASGPLSPRKKTKVVCFFIFQFICLFFLSPPSCFLSPSSSFLSPSSSLFPFSSLLSRLKEISLSIQFPLSDFV